MKVYFGALANIIVSGNARRLHWDDHVQIYELAEGGALRDEYNRVEYTVEAGELKERAFREEEEEE